MASPIVLTFDAEGRAVDFDVWVDDLQLFLQCDSRDGESLFDHTSGVSTAPAAIADSTVRLQWTTRDAVTRRAVCSHLPALLLPCHCCPHPPHGASESTALCTSESAAPGAGESALSSTAPTEALHTFTLDSSASRSFFRDSTTLTPLSRPIAVSLADPSGGPVLAHSSTVLPCRACCRDSTSPRSPRTCLYTLTTASPPVTASGQVAAFGQVFSTASRSSLASAPCSCRPLSHETLLWHHRLGHPSLPRLRGMASRTLGHERYFLLVVDEYSRYTTVFPLRSNDRGGEFSSDLLRVVCRAEGIRQTFTLPASPQQNGIAERSIGMVMDVARTSMIHAAAPHFLWPFTVQYSAHQINLQPRVSLPETTPTLRLTGKVGDASVFRVWGSRAFVRDASADKLSSCAVLCVFLGFPPDAPGWQFYNPTSRHVLSSQDPTFDESVSYYRLFTYSTASLPPPPLFLAPSAPPVDPLPPQGPAPSGVSLVDPVELVEVDVDSSAARGAEPAGAGTGGVEPGGAESGGAEPGGAELEGAEPGGAESRGAELGGAELERAESGGPPGVPSHQEPLSPQHLCEWYTRHGRRAARGAASAASAGGASGAAGGAAGAGAAGAVGLGGAGAGSTAGAGGAFGAGVDGGPAGVGAAGGARAAGPGGARTGGTGAAGAGGAAGVGAVGAGAAGGTGAGGAAGVVAGDPGAEGTGAVSAISKGTARPRSYYVPLLQQPASPLPSPSPYFGPTRGLTERRELESRPESPESRPASLKSQPKSPVCTVRNGRRVTRQRPPPVPGTHSMTLRPSTAPQRVPLPSPPASSLPALADPGSDSLRTASPTATRLLITAVTNPSFESTAASALDAELVDFAAHCCLDYAAGLVAESESASVCPPSVGVECALGTDVLEDRQEDFECIAAAAPHLVSTLLAPQRDPDAPDIPTPRSYAEAIEGPYSSQWQAAMDAEMASCKSTGTYVNEVPPPGANIVSGMWIFRVKRPPGSPPVFKARYVARGFSQQQGVDFFHTFSPTPKMTTLRVLLHVAAQRDYKLHSLDFSTAFLRGSLHEEIWLRRPSGFTGSFPAGTEWSLRRPVYGLRQAPREWHDTLRMTLAALSFAPSTADPSLFLRTHTTLPPFYILVVITVLLCHDTLRTTLAALDFFLSSADPLLFVRRGSTPFFVLVYVDDLVFATPDRRALASVKEELQKRHTCTDLDPHVVSLPVLQGTAHPSCYGHGLTAPPLDEPFESSGPYPELVGCLMYPMTCTRPELAYPLSVLARFVVSGRHLPSHWYAAKRVVKYVASTSGMGLVLGGKQPVTLTGFSGSSWADDAESLRSTQGYCFSLGTGAVSWRATQASSVSSFSSEAEVYAAVMATQELRWLSFLLTDLGERRRSPPVLFADNRSVILLCEEPRLVGKAKHIQLRYFLLQELQQCGQALVRRVVSEANTAYIFTKALPPCDHQRYCTQIGLVPTGPHLLT
ncbi:unnamed protein product [Closterium sp. NIES-54]